MSPTDELAIEGVTGQEQAIAAEVGKALREVGVPAKAIRHDTAQADRTRPR